MNKITFVYANKKEFEKFLKSLPEKDAAKLLMTIKVISDNGLSVAAEMQWTKKIDDNLFEIRSRFSNNSVRAIYFYKEENKYVITHGFKKKSMKTPKKEIARAKSIRDNY